MERFVKRQNAHPADGQKQMTLTYLTQLGLQARQWHGLGQCVSSKELDQRHVCVSEFHFTVQKEIDVLVAWGRNGDWYGTDWYSGIVTK